MFLNCWTIISFSERSSPCFRLSPKCRNPQFPCKIILLPPALEQKGALLPCWHCSAERALGRGAIRFPVLLRHGLTPLAHVLGNKKWLWDTTIPCSPQKSEEEGVTPHSDPLLIMLALASHTLGCLTVYTHRRHHHSEKPNRQPCEMLSCLHPHQETGIRHQKA